MLTPGFQTNNSNGLLLLLDGEQLLITGHNERLKSRDVLNTRLENSVLQLLQCQTKFVCLRPFTRSLTVSA